jgi:hypothetical protein
MEVSEREDDSGGYLFFLVRSRKYVRVRGYVWLGVGSGLAVRH